jgi:hypothetical protein
MTMLHEARTDRVIEIHERDLIAMIRCALFLDSACRNIPPDVMLQLTPEHKKKVREWLNDEWDY